MLVSLNHASSFWSYPWVWRIVTIFSSPSPHYHTVIPGFLPSSPSPCTFPLRGQPQLRIYPEIYCGARPLPKALLVLGLLGFINRVTQSLLSCCFHSQSLFQMQSLPSVLGSGSGIEVPLFISSLRCFSLNKLKQSLFMSLSVSLCLHTYKSFKSKISTMEKWEVTLCMGGTWVKNLPAIAGDRRYMGSIPRSGRPPGGGHGNPLQYSCLENPMDRRTWWVPSPWGHKESDTIKVI